MGTNTRRGFSLIELVTVIAVGSVGTAMVLPALQFGRETARRSQCVNNLKQIGLALHNYHSANDSLPMSDTRGPGHGNGHSGFTAILPYLEQMSSYNAYNFHLENWHAANATGVSSRVATYLCPSNEDRDPVPAAEVRTAHDKPFEGKNKFARLHYGMNWGGVRPASGSDEAKAYGESWRGLLLTVVDPDAPKKTVNVKFTQVTDGLSFTVAVLEKRDSFGWGVGGWGGSEFDVNTVPNYAGKDPKALRVFTGSAHPGGLNALVGDGSVKFMKDTIDPTIWRALTTRAGGEPIKPGEW